MSLPASAPAAPAAPAAPLVSVALLRALGVAQTTAMTWSPYLSSACAKYAINTRLRVAAFVANIVHETGGLSVLSESLNYMPSALLAQWPSHFTVAQAYAWGRTAQHPANEFEIAEHAYGGRMGNGPVDSGDGALFKGEGPMETTGRENFTSLAKALGWTKPLSALPAYLQTPEGGSLSAAIYWNQNNINRLADQGNITAVRKAVNGGEIGLPDVQKLYAQALTLLR